MPATVSPASETASEVNGVGEGDEMVEEHAHGLTHEDDVIDKPLVDAGTPAVSAERASPYHEDVSDETVEDEGGRDQSGI